MNGACLEEVRKESCMTITIKEHGKYSAEDTTNGAIENLLVGGYLLG